MNFQITPQRHLKKKDLQTHHQIIYGIYYQNFQSKLIPWELLSRESGRNKYRNCLHSHFRRNA